MEAETNALRAMEGSRAEMRYCPLYLDLRGRRCVVIGGGPIAERKVRLLLEAGADVTVISPQLTSGLEELAQQGRITHIARAYRPGDLADAFLVISATDDQAVNHRVWREATERAVLVNVADDPSRCDFILPATVRRGDLTIAISTGGKAPALAVRLRQWLERSLGQEYARFLELASPLRPSMAERYADFEERRRRWYQLVDSDVLDLLRQGDERAARRRMAEILGLHPVIPSPERGQMDTPEGQRPRESSYPGEEQGRA